MYVARSADNTEWYLALKLTAAVFERARVTDPNSIRFIGDGLCVVYYFHMLELSHKILLYSLELSCMVYCDVGGKRRV